jgi:hypothetical protein
MHRTKSAILAVLAIAGMAACSSSERVGGVADSSSAVSTTTDMATTTSSASTTSAAPETTLPPAPPDTPAPTAPTAPPTPLLLGDGIGTASFGDSDDAVLALLTPAFGGVASDTSQTLDVNVGVDTWQSADGELQYTAPIARDVCFANKVCVTFGGADAADLRFTGWYANEEGAPAAETIEGIHLGDTWAAQLAAITRLSGGCYSYGTGTSTDGIEVGMISSDEMFNYYDDATSTWLDGAPDPAAVEIVYLAAGDLVVSLFADC